MNWLKKISNIKIASVTFSIEGAHKISQPKNLSDISSGLIQWAIYNIPHGLASFSFQDIMPDGTDFDKGTGIINWYIPKNTDPQEIVPYVNQAIEEELKVLGLEANISQINTSQMYEKDVIRLKITKNETLELEKMTELNVSNANYQVINNILELSTPNAVGSISAQDLINRVSQARAETQIHTRQTVTDGNFTDYGVDELKIHEYLDALENIADRAMEMNSPMIVWY